MADLRYIILSLLMGLLFPAGAMAHESDNSKSENVDKDTNPMESLFPDAGRNLAFSHFTWGAEVGSSIDLTGNDMSTFDADVNIGYKNDFIRLVGLGVGINRAFGTGNNFVPVYAVFRSSFTKKPSLFFFTFKTGYSFNTIGDSPTFGDTWASIGCGVNLAMNKNFKSHLSFAIGYRHFNRRHQEIALIHTDNVYLAQINFGVNF